MAWPCTAAMDTMSFRLHQVKPSWYSAMVASSSASPPRARSMNDGSPSKPSGVVDTWSSEIWEALRSRSAAQPRYMTPGCRIRPGLMNPPSTTSGGTDAEATSGPITTALSSSESAVSAASAAPRITSWLSNWCTRTVGLARAAPALASASASRNFSPWRTPLRARCERC